MSNDYDNTNSGVLFKNDNKTKQNQPDHRGSIHVQCPCCSVVTEFWLSAWIKTAGPSARNPGSRFFSLAITTKDDQGQDSAPDKPAKKRVLNDDGEFDDIPF